MHSVARLEVPEWPHPVPWLGAGGEQGSIYVLRRGDEVLWRVGINFGEASHVPFREELVWESAGVVALGGGDAVYVLDLGTGAARARIAVPSLFGHLALVSVAAAGGGSAEILLLLGWTDVHAIDGQLAPCWIARDVAVDGILLREVRGQELHVLAEMDPPGGWVGVVLDIRTGAELSREAEPVADEEGPGAPVEGQGQWQ